MQEVSMCSAVTRRSAVAGLAASGLAFGTMPGWGTGPGRKNQRFLHGVASGDPDRDSVVLWTRVETRQQQKPVSWEMASDSGFKNIVQRGTELAVADKDHTVKILVKNLRPNREYFYRFHVGGDYSPAGRTKVLPSGNLDRLGIALASCSNYAFGFFNAYDAIARDESIDFVLHTGDYIYEYGADGWGADVARALERVHEPANEIVSLEDYRTRHAQYKRDFQSQAMHAAHPLIAVWDDHESANNPWLGGAQNHDPDAEGDWRTRRDASLKAYYEWMPIREPADGSTRADYWRSLSFGDLASLITLETRHTARSEQIDYQKYRNLLTSREQVDIFKRDILGAEDRRMLSPAMEQDLYAGLAGSVAAGQPWRLIGNPMPMARMLVPDLVGLGILPDMGQGSGVPGAGVALGWKGQWGLPFYTDTWDGYPAARERFYDLCRRAGAADLLVLTGDSHSFWANRLYDDGGAPMGLEIGTAGVSSPGDFVESGFDRDTAERLDRAFEQELPEVVWTDNFHQGYVRLDLSRDQVQTEFVAMDTVLKPEYSHFILKQATIRKSGKTIDYVELR